MLNERLKLITGSVTPFGVLNGDSKETVEEKFHKENAKFGKKIGIRALPNFEISILQKLFQKSVLENRFLQFLSILISIIT